MVATQFCPDEQMKPTLPRHFSVPAACANAPNPPAHTHNPNLKLPTQQRKRAPFVCCRAEQIVPTPTAPPPASRGKGQGPKSRLLQTKLPSKKITRRRWPASEIPSRS